MAAITPCTPCCTTPQTTGVPGPQGDTGPAGAGTVTQVSETGDFLTITNQTTTPDISVTGVLPAANGGTANTSLSDTWDDLVTVASTALPIAAGGTNATTAAAARTSLGVPPIPVDPIISTDSTDRNFVVGASARMGSVEVTLTDDGHWLLLLTAQACAQNTTNPADNTELHLIIYRTNNGAGNVTNGEFVVHVHDWGTYSSDCTVGTFALSIPYTAADVDDNLQLYGYQVTALTGGSAFVLRDTKLTAVWVKE